MEEPRRRRRPQNPMLLENETTVNDSSIEMKDKESQDLQMVVLGECVDESPNPALIKCPDCGAYISAKAAACIKCGCPMRPEIAEPVIVEKVKIVKEPVVTERVVVEEKQQGMGFCGVVCAIVVGLFIFSICG